MNRRLIPALATVILTLAPLPCLAQPEGLREGGKQPETLPTPTPAPAPACGQPCLVPVEKTTTSVRLHWLEREVPTTVQKFKTREEVVGQEVRTTYELNFHEHKAVRTETVLKPREVVKDVTVCTMKPEKVTDPHTGCCTIVMTPITEVKQVREIVYETVCETKEYLIRVPYLKPVDKVYDIKKIVLDITPTVEVMKERFGVLAPVTTTETVLVPAAPCCPDKGGFPK